MKNSGIRRFTRVNFRQAVQLDFGERQYEQQIISNLSLGGMYIKGRFEQRPGDICSVIIRPSWPEMPTDFRAKGSVVWVTDEGMAVEFVSMGYDSFLFLQTVLLYEADDPASLSSEFTEKNVDFEVRDEEDSSEVQPSQHSAAGEQLQDGQRGGLDIKEQIIPHWQTKG